MLRCVFSDIKRELVHIAVYAALASMTLYSALSLIASIGRSDAADWLKMSEALMNDGLTMIDLRDEALDVPKELRVNVDAPVTAGPTLDEVLERGFSREGHLGSYFYERYQGVGLPGNIVFVGKCVDMTSVEVPRDSDIYICVSADRAEMVGKTVNVLGHELTVAAAVPDSAVILRAVNRELASNIDETLYVFARDPKTVRRLFAYPYSVFVNDNLIALGAGEEELEEALSALHRETGKYAYAETVREFTAGRSGRMTMYVTTLFKGVSALALVLAMALNIAHALGRRTEEYRIHHLFGAPSWKIYARMLLFGVLYNLIPTAYCVFRVFLPIRQSTVFYPDGTAEITRFIDVPEKRLIPALIAVLTAVLLTVLFTVTVRFIGFARSVTENKRGE